MILNDALTNVKHPTPLDLKKKNRDLRPNKQFNLLTVNV